MVKTAPARSAEPLQTDALELVEKGIILHPDLPRAQLAEILLDEAEPELLLRGWYPHWLVSPRPRDWSRPWLTIRHLMRLIRSERLKARRLEPAPPLFAGRSEERRVG